MTVEDAVELLRSLQKSFDKKDLQAAIKFYHPDICFINPAFPEPIEGIEALEAAFRKHFNSPQRTSMSFHNVGVQDLGNGAFIIRCLVEGFQSILFSGQRFVGYLSRVFVNGDTNPLIIHEHFSFRR